MPPPYTSWALAGVAAAATLSGMGRVTPHGHSSPHAIRQTTGDEPRITITRPDGPVRVDAKDGSVTIRQTRRTAGRGEFYPKCLLCHSDIENVTKNMLGLELDCTFCHGGDPMATTIADAHIFPNGNVVYDNRIPPIDDDLAYQKFINPSNLRAVDDTCGICHPSVVRKVRKSMMATTAGHYGGGFYQNGVTDSKTPIYGNFAVIDDDGVVPTDDGAVKSLLDLLIYDASGDQSLFATHYAAVPAQACARCHLWSRGRGYRGAEDVDGTYRADGCAACHMLYANDGLSMSNDASIDHSEPGHPKYHVITKAVPTEQCLHCHHRGARIGLNFTGRAQMPPRLPSGPDVPGTTDERFNRNYHYTVSDTNPQDIHGQAGMHCIDCHTSEGVMGDDNIWGHMDQATKVECRTCHGTPTAMPTLLDNDGEPLINVENTGGEIVLTSKVTGEEHIVPPAIEVIATNPKAACAMNDNHIKSQGGLECYACHSSWVPNCFGCHFERDEQQMGLNLWTREMEIGKVTTNNKIFEALRHFALGPNSEGRVAPYIVSCHPIADVTAADGEKKLDFAMPVTANGLSGLGHNPVQPHTVRGQGEVRTCAECHRSPSTMGFGSGNYTVARERLYTAGGSGVTVYQRNGAAEQPLPTGTLPVVGETHAIASVPHVVEGTAEFLYTAQGANGLAIFDLRENAPVDPVTIIGGIDAIDVARVARYLYVIDAGVGLHIYDNQDPAAASLVSTITMPGAIRVVPWGIHLLVAAGNDGLNIINIADHSNPWIERVIGGMDAIDIRAYAHFQAGSAFASRAYVADPSAGVRIVDLLPDMAVANMIGTLPMTGAVGLDTYTRWIPATEVEPSREHDYLYVAAGSEGMRIYDISEPDAILEIASVDLGGFATDVDVASQLAPPGVDDYAIIANQHLGLQVVDVSDPRDPVVIGTVPASTGATRVFLEVQQMDRFLDEQGNTLKENSHPFVDTFSRDEIVRILSASIDCDEDEPCDADVTGDGLVDVTDLLAVIAAWGPCDIECPGDVSGDGLVDVTDLLAIIAAWGPC